MINSITPKDYQERLAVIYGYSTSIPHCASALLEEYKEVLDLLERDNKEHGTKELERRLGSIIAYTCLLLTTLGFDFEDILLANIKELEASNANGTLELIGSDR